MLFPGCPIPGNSAQSERLDRGHGIGRDGLMGCLRMDLERALAVGAARTPLDSPQAGVWLGVWGLACLGAGLGLWLAGGYHCGFAALNAAATAWPDWIWEWLTSLSGQLTPLVLGLLLAHRYPRVFWALILAGIAGFALSQGLKLIFDAARPPVVLPPGSFHLIGPAKQHWSFPSGHSMTAGVFGGVLVHYTRWSVGRGLWVLTALLIGLSRVAVGVHWPVDVACGLGGGVLAAWLGIRLAARWNRVATDPAVHLALVTLCACCALTLILGESDYPQAQAMRQVLGWIAFGYSLASYVAWPVGRCLRQSSGWRNRR